jgi:mannose/fructose-specific phosphotransferase system component IIA
MKIIVATHGYLADGYRSSLKLLVGEFENVSYINAYVDDVDFKAQLSACLADWNDEQIVILTDIWHGSINQAAIPLIGDRITVITGFNLALFLEIVLAGKDCSVTDLKEIVEMAKEQMKIVEIPEIKIAGEDFF